MFKSVIANSIVPGFDVFGVRALSYGLQSALVEIKINRQNSKETAYAFVIFHKQFFFNLKKMHKNNKFDNMINHYFRRSGKNPKIMKNQSRRRGFKIIHLGL